MDAGQLTRSARLAEERWWLGDVPETLRLEEQLHDALVACGRDTEAAQHGLRIALLWGTRGDLSLAHAWWGRAARILATQPECATHGYAAYVEASVGLEMESDPAVCAGAADRLREIARRHPDPAVTCFALTIDGMSAVRSGDLDGFTALDEAMIPVLAGRVDPLWGGDIFCTVIHLCDLIGDVGRMRAWTRSLQAWAAPLSSTFLYAGVTRVHQLQLLRIAGEWDVVEKEMGEESAALVDRHGWLAGGGFYELGEVHRLRGHDDQARTAYARARELGVDPQPGEALQLHAAGDSARALDVLRVALAGAAPLVRAQLIPPTCDIAVSVGATALAGQLADEVAGTAERFTTPGIVAGAARARATCLMADGSWDEAEERLYEAARLHRRQGQRHELAEVHELLARVHRQRGRDAAAGAAEATARAIYAALGATAALRRMDRLRSPSGLTAREVEVLVKVAAGMSNKEVAAALVISDKTVGRHLSNIFTKTGTTSRTGAVAWARTQRLV